MPGLAGGGGGENAERPEVPDAPGASCGASAGFMRFPCMDGSGARCSRKGNACGGFRFRRRRLLVKRKRRRLRRGGGRFRRSGAILRLGRVFGGGGVSAGGDKRFVVRHGGLLRDVAVCSVFRSCSTLCHACCGFLAYPVPKEQISRNNLFCVLAGDARKYCIRTRRRPWKQACAVTFPALMSIGESLLHSIRLRLLGTWSAAGGQGLSGGTGLHASARHGSMLPDSRVSTG